MFPNIITGDYTGDGGALNIILGWVPDYVRVVNATDGDVAFEWFRGMAAANVLQTTNHDNTQLSLVTSNGITAYEGDDGAGFTVGSALSESSKKFYFIAVRGGAPAVVSDPTP